MEMLSEDDLNLKDMTLAQTTNDSDPPYTHGVFVLYDTLPLPDPPAQPSPALLQIKRKSDGL